MQVTNDLSRLTLKARLLDYSTGRRDECHIWLKRWRWYNLIDTPYSSSCPKGISYPCTANVVVAENRASKVGQVVATVPCEADYTPLRCLAISAHLFPILACIVSSSLSSSLLQGPTLSPSLR